VLSASVARQPVTMSLLLAVPCSQTPQQPSGIVLLLLRGAVAVAPCLTHRGAY